jgi:hypothetical protein
MQENLRAQMRLITKDKCKLRKSRFADSESQNLATKKFSRKTPKRRQSPRQSVLRGRIEARAIRNRVATTMVDGSLNAHLATLIAPRTSRD